MAATNYTDADLIAIRRAIAKGERSVQFADRMVTYRSADELLSLELRIVQSLAATDTTRTRRSRQTLMVGNKGF